MKGRFTCLLCGRATLPAALIGDRYVGPKCARSLGISRAVAKKNPRIRVFERAAPVPVGVGQGDLFEVAA